MVVVLVPPASVSPQPPCYKPLIVYQKHRANDPLPNGLVWWMSGAWPSRSSTKATRKMGTETLRV